MCETSNRWLKEIQIVVSGDELVAKTVANGRRLCVTSLNDNAYYTGVPFLSPKERVWNMSAITIKLESDQLIDFVALTCVHMCVQQLEIPNQISFVVSRTAPHEQPAVVGPVSRRPPVTWARQILTISTCVFDFGQQFH